MAEQTRNSAIDLTKFVLALFVIAIHVRPFSGEAAFFVDDVIAQMADPLFFTLSAYLFFSKRKEKVCDAAALGHYMKRIGILYGVWSLIYSPRIFLLVWQETKEASEAKMFAFYMLRRLLLQGPYGALWFLTALLLAMPLAFFVGRYLGAKGALFVSAPFYLFTALEMSWRPVERSILFLASLRQGFEAIFGWLANGLTYGFFFCSLGLLLAQQNHTKSSASPRRMEMCRGRHDCEWVPALGLALAIALRFTECILTRTFETAVGYGAGFAQIFVAYFGVKCLAVYGNRQQEQNDSSETTAGKAARFLQRMSILLFTMHYGLMELFDVLWQDVSIYENNGTLRYLWVVGLSCLVAAIVVACGEKKGIRWLRILY